MPASRVRAHLPSSLRSPISPVGALVPVAGLALLAILFSVSCGSSDGTGETVTSTIPGNGETGVDPRSIVAIHLSDIMTEVDDNLEPELIRVTGDLTDGDYQGTISVANWKSDVVRGMTVDEFSPSMGGARARRRSSMRWSSCSPAVRASRKGRRSPSASRRMSPPAGGR